MPKKEGGEGGDFFLRGGAGKFFFLSLSPITPIALLFVRGHLSVCDKKSYVR